MDSKFFAHSHQVSDYLFNGPNEFDEVHHLCGLESCMNPVHLKGVTRKVNAIEREKDNSPFSYAELKVFRDLYEHDEMSAQSWKRIAIRKGVKLSVLMNAVKGDTCDWGE